MSEGTGAVPRGRRPVVAVVGAGFGGLEFCKRFRGDADVLLIDRQNHHLFQPLLYQVAMAGLSAPDVAAPIRSVLSGHRRVVTRMAEVQAIDLEARTLRAGGRTLHWDWLVLAAGGVTSYFGHDEWRRHALGLKTLEDALAIRSHILTSFEKAENEVDPEERRRRMTIVVAGGGPTGVELAGAMAELAHRVFRRDFRRIDPAESRVVLVEATERILPAFPPELSRKAERQLADLGVELRLGTAVRGVESGRVTLEGPGGEEAIETHNVLWAAGVSAHPLVRSLGVEVDRAGRARVEPDLSLPGHPRAFVIGDAAALEVDGVEVPGLAPAAIQMGRHVAKIIERELASADAADPPPRPPFRYVDRGTMATIGRRRAIAVVGPVRASGWIAWLVWLFVHLMTLVGFRNRVFVFFDWMWQYFTYERGARIITAPRRETSWERNAALEPDAALERDAAPGRPGSDRP